MTCLRCRDKGWFNARDYRGVVTPTPCACVRPNETALGFVSILSMAAAIALLAMWWPL